MIVRAASTSAVRVRARLSPLGRRPEQELALARSCIAGLEGAIAPDANHFAAMSNPTVLNRLMLAKLSDERALAQAHAS